MIIIKKILKVLILTFIVMSLGVPSLARAEGTKKKLQIIGPPAIKDGISMLQGSDIVGELPPIDFLYNNGEPASGTITYPNYDNMRLGVWEMEIVFTPDDISYETGYYKIKLNVRAPEPEALDEFTSPSLTASTVQLNTMTTYDINLDNKVSGSTYKWTSSDTNVVEVNAKSGLLKAKKEGAATVTCEITLPDKTTKKLTSEVTVGYDDNAPVLTETELDLEPGDVFDINLENKVAKAKYRWASSDRSIAKVNSANGKVTAVAPGTAYVTCTITTPENQVIVLRADISVTAPTIVTE